MPDYDEHTPIFDTAGDERGYVGAPQEEIPGHTPGTAEGEDESAPRIENPYPDPDKTPGNAEG